MVAKTPRGAGRLLWGVINYCFNFSFSNLASPAFFAFCRLASVRFSLGILTIIEAGLMGALQWGHFILIMFNKRNIVFFVPAFIALASVKWVPTICLLAIFTVVH